VAVAVAVAVAMVLLLVVRRLLNNFLVHPPSLLIPVPPTSTP
jgi:hypothetical protein